MTLLRRVVMLPRSHKFGGYRMTISANCAFATMPRLLAWLVLFSVVHPAWVRAASPDQDRALTGSRERIEKLDYRTTGRLTRVDGSGKRTNYKIVAKAHWFPDGLRLLCEITGPGAEKTSLLLHMSATGHMNIEAVLPGEKTASALPFERWNDPLVGTDFSYEDMVENQFFWKNQEALPPQKYGARDCLVLKSKSGPQDRTYYDSVTSWIDRGILYPVHVVKTLRGTGQQKEFIYYGRVKALTAIRDVALISVGGPGIVGVPDVVGRTFSTTAELRANVLLISQSSSQNDICFIVASADAQRTVEALRREFASDLSHEVVEHITVDPNIAIVAVVGENMRGTRGVAGRTFAAMGRDNVNIIAIAQGSSETNISFVVEDSAMKQALLTAHGEFELGN